MINGLNEASREGWRIAKNQEERGIVSAAKNLAGRAVQIIEGIVAQLTEKVQSLLDDLLGNGETDEDIVADVESQVEAWAAEYSELVAATEIHAAIEEAVLDEMKAQRIEAINWNAEPDACERCLANEEASPIRIDTDFPSGDTVPPAHPRCRCTTSPA